MANVSVLVFGNSQSTSGPIMREVFEAEKLSDEANEINASQATSGRYRLRNLVKVATFNLLLCALYAFCG